jgi:hypothetical protein
MSMVYIVPALNHFSLKNPKSLSRRRAPHVDFVERNYLQGITWYSNRIPMGLMDRHAFGKIYLDYLL